MYNLASRRRVLDVCLAGIVLAAPACAGAPTPASSPAPRPVALTPPGSGGVRESSARPQARGGSAPSPVRTQRRSVDSTALERAVTARLAHRPLALALARRTHKPELADRAAAALVREAIPLRMSPSLLAAVLLVENRMLDTSAVSNQGAVGLMQVMPMHAGSYGCTSVDLHDVDANICHGARLLHLYLVRSRSVQVALRRYNGCVRGANTPRCHRYPIRVLRTASRLRHEVLASARTLQARRPPLGPPREYAKATSPSALDR